MKPTSFWNHFKNVLYERNPGNGYIYRSSLWSGVKNSPLEFTGLFPASTQVDSKWGAYERSLGLSDNDSITKSKKYLQLKHDT